MCNSAAALLIRLVRVVWSRMSFALTLLIVLLAAPFLAPIIYLYLLLRGERD